jgi:hypothetical protein
MVINLLQTILDWSEVWAPLLALLVLSFTGKQPRYLIPVIIYVWFALVVDTFIDAGWKFRQGVPGWMYPNNYLYNIHSIGRFFCFSAFFYLLGKIFRTSADKLVFALAVLFIVVNFCFLERFYEPRQFSSRLFSVEAGLLLFYCIRYYWFRAQTIEKTDLREPDFWVVTGLSIYVVFNFFYFLFYTTLIAKKEYISFVTAMWNCHNITFIILCGFIARAFYVVEHK